MYIDAQLLFSDAQAVTAAAGSSNVIDTGPLFSGITGRNLGVGARAYIWLTVDTTFTDSGSDSTLAVSLETDDNAAFSSATSLGTLTTLAALTASGTSMFFPLPVASAAAPYERYIRLKYTPANGDLSAGAISAGITTDIQQWVSTVGGFSTGV
jgi:hypothetical protein